jgi:hypothetical protein
MPGLQDELLKDVLEDEREIVVRGLASVMRALSNGLT